MTIDDTDWGAVADKSLNAPDVPTVKIRTSPPTRDNDYSAHQFGAMTYTMRVGKDGWIQIVEYIGEDKGKALDLPPSARNWLLEVLAGGR